MQVLKKLQMMYLSAFPVTMAIRNTNIYEERSLGVFADELPSYQESDMAQDEKKDGLLNGLKRTITMTHGGQATKTAAWQREDFIRLQLRSQLGHDLWVSTPRKTYLLAPVEVPDSAFAFLLTNFRDTNSRAVDRPCNLRHHMH